MGAGQMTLSDLTPGQTAELEALLTEFVRDRALDGLNCIVIVDGRGQDRLAYPEHISAEAPRMLERAMLTARKRNARMAN